LTVLAPGAALPAEQEVDWDALSRFLDTSPALLACWRLDQADADDLQRLAFCLAQRQGWSGDLTLPWPSALSGWCSAEPSWRCRLRGQARWDALGQFAGFSGVWVLDGPERSQSASAPLGADVVCTAAERQPDSDAARMLESEQEALRYALSHDLRAPLRVVEGFTRIVKEDYGQQLDRMGQDHLDRVLAAATRMHGMIDAILAQAQLASTPLQRVSVDITALAREIGDDVLSSLDNRRAAHIVVAEDMRIDADPQLVRRVLENLIGNAFKYSAKVAEPRVDVGMMPATNPAVFYVRDNGAGFDMQHADKLFGMFQRLHSAKEFPGTGVGLAGVQNIIRRHGGRVWAEARPGEGACFYFTLMDVQTAQQRVTRSE
jgi:signal transduction histidine kinase